MINTPLAAPSPTSASKTSALSAAPNRTKHDAAEKSTPSDIEGSKGFSDFFQEAGTLVEPNEPQKAELPTGATDITTTAIPDDASRADLDVAVKEQPVKMGLPGRTSSADQNPSLFSDNIGIPATKSNISTAIQGPTNTTDAYESGTKVPIANANNAAINTPTNHHQATQPLNPAHTFPTQNITMPAPSQNNLMKDSIFDAQRAVIPSNTNSAAQTSSPAMVGNETMDRIPMAPNTQIPVSEVKHRATSREMPHSAAPSLAQSSPRAPSKAFEQASNTIPDPATVSKSPKEPHGQATNPNASNPQAVVSNLGQTRTASIKDREPRNSLPPAADSTAVAARAKMSTPTTSNRGPAQSATTANSNAPLDNTLSGEAAIEWQADAELIFDPKADPRAAVTGTGIGTSRSDPIFQRPEIPRQIANQLADIAQRMTGKSVELSLNPEELGRIRLSLTPADAGMVVTVVAERGETLDLMRRNIEILAQEFRDIGYDDVSFSFGQQSGESTDNSSGGSDDPQSSTTRNQDPTAPEQQKPYQITLSPTDGIDIRV